MNQPQDFGEVPHAPHVTSAPADRNGVLIPMLISGIFNIFSAIAWAFTCVGIPLSALLTVLAIFEFITFANGQTMPRGQIASRSGVLGVLEICTIITGNLGSFICGIIVVVNRGKL